MKYDLQAFNNSVKYYEKNLSKHKGKSIYIVFDQRYEKAFFSLAPLSRALHNLSCDLSVSIVNKTSPAIDALMEVWGTFEDLEAGKKNEASKILGEFIAIVDKKAKGAFKEIFKKPDLFINADNNEFITNEGESFELADSWFRKHRWDELLKTGTNIWKNVYDLKKNERVGFGFDLIMRAEDIEYPLEDYLDSYAIAWTMFLSCYAKTKGIKTSSERKTMLEKAERTSELSATLLGCELEKDIDEPIFKVYKKLSKLLRLDRFKTNTATFLIKGEGYSGKHIFGECIGYPTPNKKSRWDSPGGLIYQFPWYPQTKIDGRGPRCRVAFTDTVPLDIYIDSSNVDWLKMKRIDDKLKELGYKSEKIVVSSKISNFEVGLVKKDGKRRILMNSDVDIRTMLDIDALREGVKAGNMNNIPSGEMFLTPEYINGTFYGDVVINIDKSYMLSSKDPLVVECKDNTYKIIKGPKRIIAKLNENKNEAMNMLKTQEKNKSLPKSIIELKKKNFNGIAEFAINTNPMARLCNYLIVNEKIAGMIHIALGSGFEADRTTLYHYDIVINAKRQKLDIYGVGKDGKKHWMMKKGRLLFGWD